MCMRTIFELIAAFSATLFSVNGDSFGKLVGNPTDSPKTHSIGLLVSMEVECFTSRFGAQLSCCDRVNLMELSDAGV